MWFMNFSCVAAMLRSTLADGLITQRAALKYIGERFRLKAELPEWTSDEDVARYLLKYVGLPLQRELLSNLIPPTPTTPSHHPQTPPPPPPPPHHPQTPPPPPSPPPPHLALVTCRLMTISYVLGHVTLMTQFHLLSLLIQGSCAGASREECRQVQSTHVSFSSALSDYLH